MDLKDALKELKVDYDTAITRFANSEAMYSRFLKRFLDDNTYNQLEQGWDKGDYKEIEDKAHTLKGIAGNLCLNDLFLVSNDLVQKLRNNEYEDISTIYQNLQKEYNRVVTIITNIN